MESKGAPDVLSGWSRFNNTRPPAVLQVVPEGVRITRFFGADRPDQALAAWQQMGANGGDTESLAYIVRVEDLTWRDIEDAQIDAREANTLVLPFTGRKSLANLMLSRRCEFAFAAEDAARAAAVAARIRESLPPAEPREPAVDLGETLGPLASRVRQAAGRLGKMITGREESRPAPATGSGPDLDLLERLAEMRERGILTDEEFEAKKKQILGL